MRDDVVETIRRQAAPCQLDGEGMDALVDAVRGARLVLVGEASHGTHEFYAAHNSHLGDARATAMGRGGGLTHTGTVTAARHWDKPAEKRQVTPSLPAQFDAVIHIDRTSALSSLERWAAEEHAVDLTDTIPSGV
jgi:erythromycin esterase-like protein